MLIYIASPYGKRRGLSLEDRLDNVTLAIACARSLIKRGHTPLIPVLYHYVDEGWFESPGEDCWLKIGLNLVPRCDAVFRVPGESMGADHEVVCALSLGIPVFHSMKEVPLLR